jgi:hypothetical protein
MSLKRKHIKLSYTGDFIDWWDEYSTNGFATYQELAEMHGSFLKGADLDKKDYSRARFKKGLVEGSRGFWF